MHVALGRLRVAIVLLRITVIVLGVLPPTILLGVLALAVFRVVELPGMLRILAFAAVIGAVVVTLRELRRLRTLGGKPGVNGIARRRRCLSSAYDSDLRRLRRRGKTDDHICSVGDFGSMCYTYTSHI